MEKLMRMDLYGLLDVAQTASTREIKTAYRKKALSCHPDKNPNNPRAAELFHELSAALEILIDESARTAYDKVLFAKEQAKIRSAQLDAKRKRFKDELEAREENFRNSRGDTEKSNEEKLKEEIERLQKEGSKLVEDEIQFVNRKILEQMGKNDFNESTDDNSRVKIKWKSGKDDEDNGGYSRDILARILSKYGDIGVLVVSGKKKGRALVEFKEKSAAEMAVQIEKGFMSNPLILEGLWETNKKTTPNFPINSRIFSSTSGEGSGNKFRREGNSSLSFSSAPDIFSGNNKNSDVDFEEMVMRNMRRAEERKKLIQEMKNHDDDGDS